MQSNKIKRAFTDPYWTFGFFLRHVFASFIPDRLYIKLEYFSGMRRLPNLKNPITYNEKLQWLKLNDIHESYTDLVDKDKVKDYVRKIIGDEYIIPTLGRWNSVDEIDYDSLPNQFVLKTTHDSGGVVVVSNKQTLDIKKTNSKLKKSLKHNYYLEHREYPYKNVEKKIIAEKFMVDESGTELKDYKFFCFNGKCKFLFIATDRNIDDVKFDFFDLDFNHLDLKQEHPWSDKPIAKPEKFDEMIQIAERLSSGFPHVRVDLYNINGAIYFGELTFFHFSGNVPFFPSSWDQKIGSWLQLPVE